MIQTNEDHTVNGTTCYLTENSSNPNSPGQGDVDGGQTTLLSPVYDLSQYSGAIVNYWKWYTNNQGNNPGTDIWKVQISNDAGENWTDLENITSSNNYWKLEQFYINDYIDISSQVQFQFIAEDIYHEGDTNTYFGFNADDQFYLVTGGSYRLNINNKLYVCNIIKTFINYVYNVNLMRGSNTN